MDDTDVTEADRVFAEHQSLLFTVAYQILGSAVDAEDVVQTRCLPNRSRWR